MQRFPALPSISNPGQNSIVPRGKNSGRASSHKKALRRKYAKNLKKRDSNGIFFSWRKEVPSALRQNLKKIRNSHFSPCIFQGRDIYCISTHYKRVLTKRVSY